MATAYVSVKFKYRKAGSSGPWTSTSWSGIVKQKIDTIAMQMIRDKHKGCEVMLVEMKWK
jgi:hypothetical protein